MKFNYVDISSGMMPLKMFLKMRDTAEEYAGVRERHTVGIPCLVIDDDIIMVRDEAHAAEIVAQYNLTEE